MPAHILAFLKRPTYTPDPDTGFAYRLGVLARTLALSLLLSLILGMAIGILQSSTNLDLGPHAMDYLLEELSPAMLLIAAVILAPIVEEALFRGPMIFFRNSRYFPFIFYALTLLFGFYHLSNFEWSPAVLWWSPLLVAPQISVGLFLGYLRVRLGLLWAMGLHALYNLFLVTPVVLLDHFDMLPT